MKLLCSLFFILSSVTLHAQTDTTHLHNTDSVRSEFPGGQDAWIHYMIRNLKYPDEAAGSNISGTVVVKFVIDVDGKVTDVEAASGPAELRDAAISLIKHSPKWIPASINGQKVKSYKTQPIYYKAE
jgi:protein TonB